MRTKNQGFTLIELLVVIAILGIIVAVAYSSYRSSVYKSRRMDAINTIINIQAAEEKYRTSNTSYGDLAQVWSGIASTPEGYYTIAISNVGATTYTITATAQGAQAADTTCANIVLAKSGATESRTPAACWK